MIDNVLNIVNIEGKIYSTSKLEKVVYNEKNTIRGEVSIATGEGDSEVSTVNIFISDTTKAGKENKAYAGWERLLGAKTVEQDGLAKADSARLSGEFSENRYFREENGELKLQTYTQIRGSFAHIDPKARPVASFKVDGLVKSFEKRESTTETSATELPSYELIIDVFNSFYKMFSPVRLVVKDPNAVKYISGAYVPGSYVTVNGSIQSTVVARDTGEDQELGFGEETVQSSYTRTEMVVVGGTAPREVSMNEAEMANAVATRNEQIAGEKAKRAEKLASGGSKVDSGSVSVKDSKGAETEEFGF